MEKNPSGPFPFTALPHRQKLQWPHNHRLPFWVIPNIEVFMLDFPMPGDANERPNLATFQHPHVRRWAQREYGNRAGVWRIMEIMARHGVRGTVALNSLVCKHRPEVVRAAMDFGWEFMGHCQTNSKRLHEVPDAHDEIKRTLDAIEAFTGARPRGWLGAGLDETWDTLDLLIEEGVDYIADWICDDMPFKMDVGGRQIVSIPYSFESNDVPAFLYRRESTPEFEQVVRSQFDTLYKESAGAARVMALAIHPWQMGLPHRAPHLDSMLGYICSHPGVWKATGSEIVDAYLASPAAV